MSLGSLRVRVFLWLFFTLLLPALGAMYLARHVMFDYLERDARAKLDAARAQVESEERAQAQRDRSDLANLCDRDVAIDRVILGLSQGHTEREVANDLEADLPILTRAFNFDVVSIFTLGAPDSNSSRSLAHEGPRPRSLRHLIDTAQRSGDRTFIERVGSTDYRMHSCIANRAAARLMIIAGRAVRELPDNAFFEARASAARLDLERGITRVMGGIGIALFIYTLFMTWILGRTMERPLRELEEAASRVAKGDLDSTIRSTFGGKADRTMGAFNRMTQELNRTQQRLLRAERIAAWRDIARRIAHEIKNPLLPIQMSIETMQKTYATKHPDFNEIFNESTVAILEEVDRLKHIVTEFSRFARMPKPNPEEIDARELVQHVVAMHATHEGALTPILPTTLRKVKADRDQMIQVLVNLVQNALDAASAHHANDPRKAMVEIELANDTTGEGILILVRDNGPGIPKDIRARIFDPYFTTKSHGTGLGLAIVHRIVSDHGGTIDIGDTEQGGTEIRVVLFAEGPQPEADASLVS